MNLEAANMTDTRAWTWARLGMVACFAAASIMFAASLNMAEGSSTAPGETSSIQGGPTVH